MELLVNGGGVDFRSSKFSKLLRISAVDFVSISVRRVVACCVSLHLFSNDFRYAATLPAVMPVSFNESLEPNPSIFLLFELLFINSFVVDGGRSGV